MPSDNSSVQAQTEKPHHYTYLKEFRTQQCPLFLQHKCTQHRPFTCFHWHFMNQRRRRPVRKRDGTFSYSPDVYCTKYDETTGICPEGDECLLLHRTAGDTERRYHLRYYKTSVCVHETDSKGHCVKNGPHCAFAHGAHDLRPPVYDVRELQVMQGPYDKQILDTPLASSVEKDRLINEDPRWNDTNFVLANYKTESCKRPPRLCRQGYACPSYHNSRDRRRSPKKFKYRSTPCPNVKHGDDWGDPTQCESGENCPYCHTRTEQQFHPEIYKSTKCNDMVQTGYCPRGPFCAFAHVEQEMTTHRDMPVPADNSLAAFVTNALPQSEQSEGGKKEGMLPEGQTPDIDGDTKDKAIKMTDNKLINGDEKHNNNNNSKTHINQMQTSQMLTGNSSMITSVTPTDTNGVFLATSAPVHLPSPIGKGRTNSMSGSVGSDGPLSSSYGKAPGSEREDMHQLAALNLRKQLQAIENDKALDANEKSKRKQNLLLLNCLHIPGSNNSSAHGPVSPSSISPSLGTSLGINATVANSVSYPHSTMSPNATSFYPPGDTVESVIGNALEEDLNLGEISLSSMDRELVRDNDNDTNSVCSSLSAGFSSGTYVGASSVPVTIPSHPGNSGYRGSISSLSPTCSPIGSIGNQILPHLSEQQKQEQQLQEAAAAFLSQPNPGKYSAPSFSEGYNNFNGMSPRSSISQSPLVGASFSGNGAYSSSANESHRLREELACNKAKLAQWEDGITQARNACEAWRKEAEEANRKAKLAEEEKLQVQKQRDESIIKLNLLKKEVDQLRGGPFLHCLQRISELEALPIAHLKQLQAQLRLDLDSLEKIVYQQTATKCVVCHERNRSAAAVPCNHFVMCDTCLGKSQECPYCHVKLQPRSNVILPMS